LLCTVWIVGIKMASKTRLVSLTFISSSNHFEEFANRIKQKYFLPEGERENIQLFANYWPKNQLKLELENKQK